METEEIIRLIFSFLGGGIVVGFIEWMRLNSIEKKKIDSYLEIEKNTDRIRQEMLKNKK